MKEERLEERNKEEKRRGKRGEEEREMGARLM